MKNDLKEPAKKVSLELRSWVALLGAAAYLGLAVGLGGCGKPGSNPAVVAAMPAEQAVQRLKSGAVIDAITHDTAMVSAGNGGGGWGDLGAVQGGTPVIPVPGEDPCADEVPSPAPNATEDAWKDALKKFGKCLRSAMEPVELARGALSGHITYARSLLEKPLSKMSAKELAELLRTQFKSPAALAGMDDATAPQRLKLRNRFEDRDLDELQRLATRLNARLMEAEGSFIAAANAHLALVEHFAATSNRWALLLLLREHATKKGASPVELAKAVVALLRASKMRVPRSLEDFPNQMLHPWAVVAISPDNDHEEDSLHEPLENPFQVVLRALAQFGGPAELVSRQRAAYVALRAEDNPPMPGHAPVDPKAVRMAVVDTGIDFVKYPELGSFLSNGRDGSMGSIDVQDGDSNPYLPARKMDGHGTGTTASVLTVLSHYAPDALMNHQVDLAMWKTNTIRDQLAAPYLGLVSWQSREAMPEVLIRQAMSPAPDSSKPKIVSISAIFQLQPFLANVGHLDAVKKAPWLWVMAAGNEGVPTDKDKVPVCLGDVPKENRVDSRILCVGALRRGIVKDQIAGYSNYGDRVDVYAYESYIDLCPNGTSCSTPAISGAAAAVAAKYPRLTPEQLKELVVQASEERVLEVDPTTVPPQPAGSDKLVLMFAHALLGDPDGGSQTFWQAPLLPLQLPKPVIESRTVRVFDPSTMMPQLMRAAGAKDAQLSL